MGDHRPRSGRFPGLATVGVVAYSIFLPAFAVFRILTEPVDPHRAVFVKALIATVCYVPLQVWLVSSAARRTHARARRWVFGAATLVNLGALLLVGADWIGNVECLAALVLILIRPRWSVPLFAAMVAATTPTAFAFGHGDWAAYFTMGMLIIGPALAAPVLLLARVHELDDARAALAEEAVVVERLRIDEELGRTLGTALLTIAADGAQASALANGDPAAAARQLEELVAGTRATVTDARRMVTRYQTASPQAELASAAQLLTAAGIPTRVLLPPGPAPRSLPEPLRAALRARTAQLLVDGDAHECLITVTRRDGKLGLELRTGRAEAALP